MEDGWFGHYGMGFEALGAEGEQGTDQTWDGSLEGYQLAPTHFNAQTDQWAEPHLQAWEWGGDPMELEISQEGPHASTGPIPSSAIPSSTSTRDDMSPSTDDSPALQSNETLPSSDAGSSSAPNDRSSTDEWLCDFTNCGKSFTHRHKLNRHRKYHFKPWRCLSPACSKAYSLRKDLVRHQATHNGRRFYCPHGGCRYAIDGTENGFTRQDNLKRHIRTRH